MQALLLDAAEVGRGSAMMDVAAAGADQGSKYTTITSGTFLRATSALSCTLLQSRLTEIHHIFRLYRRTDSRKVLMRAGTCKSHGTATKRLLKRTAPRKRHPELHAHGVRTTPGRSAVHIAVHHLAKDPHSCRFDCAFRQRELTGVHDVYRASFEGRTFACSQGCPGGCVEDTVSCASCVAYYIPGDPSAGCANDIKCVCRKP